ncbi:CoA pyrophosphatase [Rhodohalobacter barkolensis]|uniref:CoA pyrophosphatase n=2 Tax=Rhodohalobacter barkolensis TaxID=2053187 RepID=A0A2N0VGV9_9BACT|nr:CoA pyrophosphatase [Rhodohalobacter barkolensis]
MCPFPVNGDPIQRQPNDDQGHPSSVLVPLFPEKNQKLNVILTLRTNSIRHAGQISFPGGRAEVNETPIETALRESHEEIGIEPETVNIAGSISPLYLDRSHNRISPFVGFLDKKPVLTRNPNEVEEIIIVEMDQLLSDRLLKREVWELQNRELEVPYWDIHRVPLWGATAMMMSELLELYQKFLNEE